MKNSFNKNQCGGERYLKGSIGLAGGREKLASEVGGERFLKKKHRLSWGVRFLKESIGLAVRFV